MYRSLCRFVRCMCVRGLHAQIAGTAKQMAASHNLFNNDLTCPPPAHTALFISWVASGDSVCPPAIIWGVAAQRGRRVGEQDSKPSSSQTRDYCGKAEVDVHSFTRQEPMVCLHTCQIFFFYELSHKIIFTLTVRWAEPFDVILTLSLL